MRRGHPHREGALMRTFLQELRDGEGISWMIVGLVSIVVVGLGVMIWATVVDERAKDACRAKGGTVVEYDCSTSMSCTTVNTSQYTSSTTCVPVTSCSWRCD